MLFNYMNTVSKVAIFRHNRLNVIKLLYFYGVYTLLQLVYYINQLVYYIISI